jgi:CelD/BcsL family acetyltransferase involved in cellulose biosynthesis
VNATTLPLPVSGIYAHTPWRVDVIVDVEDYLRRCAQLDAHAASPFQHSSWLRHWYASVGAQDGIEPLLLTARKVGAGTDALLLPMIRRREGAFSFVECADLGITDYNAPLMRDGLQLSEGDARVLWTALRETLKGHDVLRIEKALVACGKETNPWLLMVPSRPSELFGNRFRSPDDYADWMKHIGKHARKEFERCWRVFSKAPNTRFVRAGSVDEGLALLRQLAALQNERQADTPGYQLDQPVFTEFYEGFLRDNLDSGRCVMTALMSGDEMVAGLFSLYDGERFTMLRIAMGGEQWKACAPGKLVLERSIHAMHQIGCREFDFAIGDYQHKKVFCTTPLPLREACVPLSIAGQAYHLGWRLKHAIKDSPRLLAAVRAVRQRLGRGG